jgi:hypothetical protein
MRLMSRFRFLRQALILAGIALVGFHGWLFASQVVAGRLGDPWVIFRWAAAAGLVAALVAVHRGGHSFFGRKGIAIWVLAALLHGPAVTGRADLSSIAIPEAVATVVLQIVASTALGLGLWMLAGLVPARRRPRVSVCWSVAAFAPAGALASGHLVQFSPRPPPLE